MLKLKWDNRQATTKTMSDFWNRCKISDWNEPRTAIGIVASYYRSGSVVQVCKRWSFCLHMVGKSVLLHRIKRVTKNFNLCSGCKHQKTSVHFKMYLFTCTLKLKFKPPHTWLVFCLWSATCGDPGSVTSPSGSARLSWSACPGSDSLIGYPTVPEMRNVSGNACWLKNTWYERLALG